MPLLFVYGTLQSGLSRSSYLADQKFIRKALTTPGYQLFDLGSYPGMIESSDGDCIPGELYEVDELCLEMLDNVEAVDEGLYRRSNVSLQSPLDGTSALTYLYLQSTEGRRRISQWPPSE